MDSHRDLHCPGFHFYPVWARVFDIVMIYVNVNVKEHKEKRAQEKEEQKTTTDLFREEGFTYVRKVWPKVSNNFFESDATENKANWVWWRHLNVGLEEVPQMLLLIILYIDWSRGFILSISNEDDRHDERRDLLGENKGFHFRVGGIHILYAVQSSRGRAIICSTVTNNK